MTKALGTGGDDPRFMYRVDWNLFRQFYEIVQAGSVSAAARRLNLHQPSLSAALRRLEDHLQLTLCRRGPHGVELTPAGEALFKLVGDMVEAVRLAPHLTSQAARRIEGKLRIWMISRIVSPEFDASLQSFHGRYPNVEIQIEIAPWRTVVAGVGNLDCDLGVTHDNETHPGFQYIPILRETQQLYCGRSHPLYGSLVRDPAKLAPERLILTHGDEPEDLARFRERYGLGRSVAGHAEDLHEVLRLLELGIGIGFLPTIVANLARRDSLWPILHAPLLPSYFVYVVAATPERLSTPTQLFLGEIQRRMAARQDLDIQSAIPRR